jgi:GNAT superfamily N-acetyltransferase
VPNTPRRLRIRIADWRDWKEIQALRNLLPRPFDGGLYELLHWPIYHVHYAMPVDSPTVLGFTAVVLAADGEAEDIGTVVAPDYRRQGVASQLRLTQLRDLIEMGWHSLFGEAITPEGNAWAATYMDPVAATKRGVYCGRGAVEAMRALLDRGTPPPHPLSPDNRARLAHKAGRAIEDLRRLAAFADQQMQHARLRKEYLKG